MDQIKIGKFITECRKNKKLTQLDLAERLNISDRAVSKWERGLNLPDASIMVELCDILDISINDLFNGEIIREDKYMEKAEERLLELKKKEEENNKLLLILEYVIGFSSTISFLLLIFICSYVEMDMLLKIVGIISGCIILAVGIFFSLSLEKNAGYYECSKCHHKYIPELIPFMFSGHIWTTRHLKCPKCGKKSWSKKVLTK